MEIFIQYFQTDWRVDINNLEAKLTDFKEMCRICFSNCNVSPIKEMKYEDISMDNIIQTCLSIQLNAMDMLPHQLCSGCTNQLIHFFTFRENCKVTEQVLSLAKERQIEFINELNIDVKSLEYDDDENDKLAEDSSECNSETTIKLENVKITKDINKEKPYVCDQCPKSFRSLFNFKRHKITHTVDEKIVHNEKCRKERRERPKIVKKFKCAECETVYEKRSHWREHGKETGHEIEKKNYKCTICGKMTAYGHTMKMHMLTHTADRPYMCDQCPMTFAYTHNLKRHKLTHTVEEKIANNAQIRQKREEKRKEGFKYSKTFKCLECKESFPKRSTLREHCKETGHLFEKLKYTCEVCGKMTRFPSDMANHMLIHTENKPFMCDQCPMTFAYPHNLKRHRITHSEEEKIAHNEKIRQYRKENSNNGFKYARNFKCLECKVPFAMYPLLREHCAETGHMLGEKCEVCGKIINSRGMAKHMITHSAEKPKRPYKCDKCPLSYPYLTNLNRHKLTHVEGQYVCKYCGLGFDSEDSMQQHIQKNHDANIKIDYINGLPNIQYKCDECGRLFKRQYYLDIHIRKHREIKSKFPTNNDNPNETITLNYETVTHNNETITHNNETVITNNETVIPNNETITPNNETITPNNETITPNNETSTIKDNSTDKTFSCDLCPSTFQTHRRLNSHRVRHEKKYLCPTCGISFASSTALKSHTRVHTLEKPYKCRTCEKQFAHLTTLVTHERIHTGAKPHRCDVCTRMFRSLSALNVHLVGHSGERPYKCGQCDATFRVKSSLVGHVRRHTGDRRYECGVCGKGFVGSSGRDRHEKVHRRDEMRKEKRDDMRKEKRKEKRDEIKEKGDVVIVIESEEVLSQFMMMDDV